MRANDDNSNISSLWNLSLISTLVWISLLVAWFWGNGIKTCMLGKGQRKDFPQELWTCVATSPKRRCSSSTHRVQIDCRLEKESTVKWGNDSRKTNPSTSYYVLSLCKVFLLSFSLHMPQSRYIHIWVRQETHEYCTFTIFLFSWLLFANIFLDYTCEVIYMQITVTLYRTTCLFLSQNNMQVYS